MPIPATLDTTTHRVGPYDVSESRDVLTLRMENRGEFTMKACCAVALAMLCILIVGVMSIVHTANITPGTQTMDAPERFFAPTQNHFGFLWLFSSVVMLVLVPLYVAHAYKSALCFTFDKAENQFRCGKKQICRVNRIENLRLREVKDPDARYLYMLDVIYSDGQQVLLHNGYDEREAMNLANEVSVFVSRPVNWR